MTPDATARPKLELFALERLQSTWENRVEWNVSESGVERIGALPDTIPAGAANAR